MAVGPQSGACNDTESKARPAGKTASGRPDPHKSDRPPRNTSLCCDYFAGKYPTSVTTFWPSLPATQSMNALTSPAGAPRV